MKANQLWRLLVAVYGAGAIVSSAQAVEIREIDIPAGSLASALQSLSKQSGAEIIYTADRVRGFQTNGVGGNVSAEQAVERLLEGTNLVVHKDAYGAMLIAAAETPPANASSSAAPASAQATEPQRAASQDIGPLAEVIVTARKREESILKVPVVQSVLSQDMLEQAQLHDLYTLSTHVPGLVIGYQSGVLGPQIALRGVGTTAVTPTIDQSVSLNVDGLQLTQGFAYQTAMFDVNQVEVLKGPQALFFGKNSPAGVISLRSADPTDEHEVIVRGAYEDLAREKVGELILSGPVAPWLALRLATHYSEDDGYFKNRATVVPGFGVRTPETTNFWSSENLILRGTAIFTPTDNYTARLKLNYARNFIDNNGGDQQLGGCSAGLVSFTGLPVFDPNEDCRLNRNTFISWLDPQAFPYVGNNGVPFTKGHTRFGSLEQNLEFDNDMTLTSVTGFYNFHQVALGNGAQVSGMSPLAPQNTFRQEVFTQEIRLTSDFTSPWNFMLGAFYESGRMNNHVRIYGNTAIGVPPILQQVVHDIDISSGSIFGQAIWRATEQLELAAGARVTRETRYHEQTNVATLGVPPGPSPVLDPRLRSSNFSPELSVSYFLNDDTTIFGSYREGFKSGSFNSVVYYDPTTPTSFDDEEARGGEIGIKSRLLDGHMTFNFAAYYYRYKNLQVGSTDVTPEGVIAFRTLNAATADVKGVEFDVTYAPPLLWGLTLRAAVNYNDAKYDSFPNAPCGNNQTIAQGCDQLFSPITGTYNAQDLAGERLVRAPEWVINSGFDYEVPLGRSDMALSFGAGATYSSEYSQNVTNQPGFFQPSFTKVNANIALKGRDDAWEVALIGNNLTDRITAADCANANLGGAVIFGGQQSGAETGGPAGDDYKVCTPERGRELWIRVSVRPLRMMR